LGLSVESFPLSTDSPESLTTDVVYLGEPNAPLLFVIVSGTHGVEGYAGAACQLAFLRAYVQQFANLQDVGFLLIHAANPWGFHHDRRVTQEGVDLNRNFVDFARPAPVNAGYARYHSWLIADQTSGWARLRDNLRVLGDLSSRRRRLCFQEAITQGQYSYPDGLFYGGAAPTENRRILEHIFARYLPRRQLRLMLDLHTGLGKRGAGEALSHLDTGTADYRQLSAWLAGRLSSVAHGQAISSRVSGTLVQAFDNFDDARSFALVLEFGTAKPWQVLQALRREQQMHRRPHCFPKREHEEIRKRMRAAFYIDDARWKNSVLCYFDEVLSALLHGTLGALATQTYRQSAGQWT
ncbi:MAG: DUF2817 domain-containing protein, partial [Noviherbaspirillum sp.]